MKKKNARLEHYIQGRLLDSILARCTYQRVYRLSARLSKGAGVETKEIAHENRESTHATVFYPYFKHKQPVLANKRIFSGFIVVKSGGH